MTAKSIKKRIMITAIDKMFGAAYSKALTATFKPSFLLIILNDRRILKVLTTLKVSTRDVKQRYENTRIIKSRMFQRFLR